MKPSLLFSHWKEVRAGLESTIEAFDDSELVYAPFQGSWPAGAIMLHIADAEDGWFRHVVTRELDVWPDHFTLDNYPTKAQILSVLREVHARTEAYLDQLSEEDLQRRVPTPWGSELSLLWIIWHVLEHEIHHRGELSLALGLLGREGLDV